MFIKRIKIFEILQLDNSLCRLRLVVAPLAPPACPRGVIRFGDDDDPGMNIHDVAEIVAKPTHCHRRRPAFCKLFVAAGSL